MTVAACLWRGVARPQFSLHGVLKFHDLAPHGGVLIAKRRQTGGQLAALPAPEIIRLHTMQPVKHGCTSFYVGNTVLCRKGDYF